MEPEAAPDDALLGRIRTAIAKIGSVRRAHELTGIPVGTLNKYMAGTSMPSFDKAAKIAAAAGMSVGELAGESRASTDVSTAMINAAAEIVGLVGATVSSGHKEQGVRLPDAALIGEISRSYAALLQRMDDPTDLAEARALLPWLEGRIRKALGEAAAAPGSGKREAS